MKMYACNIYMSTQDEPHLVALKCDTEHDILTAVAILARQWPRLTALDVFGDERRVWTVRKDPDGALEGTGDASPANSN